MTAMSANPGMLVTFRVVDWGLRLSVRTVLRLQQRALPCIYLTCQSFATLT